MFQPMLAAVFVQVALTFVLLFWMGNARVSSIRRGEVKIRDIALGQQAWRERETQIANAFHNQLQLPILFYALVPLLLLTRQADLLLVVLAWVFVATRVVHAAIHVTTNHVPRRFYVFLAGAVVLLVMWIVLAVRALSA